MPRKIDELVLEWQRILPIPGESAIWQKYGYVDVMPGTTEFFGFTSVNKFGVVIDRLDFFPVNPASMAFCAARVMVNRSPWRPEAGLFAPPDTAGVLQTEYPNMIRVPPSQPFSFEITNNSPVVMAGWFVSARIFCERIPN